MSFSNMRKLPAYLYWGASRFLRQLGWAGVVGLCLLIMAGGIYRFWVSPARQSVQALSQSIANAKMNPVVYQQATVEIPQRDPQQALAKFYASFPTGTNLSASLKLISQTAVRNKLLLDRGDYKLTLSSVQQGEKQKGLQRYEIQLPVSGQYKQVRSFIDDILQQLPSLALSDIQLKRETSVAPMLEGRLVFVIFVRADTWK